MGNKASSYGAPTQLGPNSRLIRVQFSGRDLELLFSKCLELNMSYSDLIRRAVACLTLDTIGTVKTLEGEDLE